MTLPNLIIAGAPKAATTSLFKWLQAHPSVVTSQAKETYYLIDPGYPLFNKNSNYQFGGIEGYAKLFPDYQPEQVCLEATPDYMYQQTALNVLSELSTQPTIIFILRDPVERVMSLLEFAKNSIGSLNKNISARDFIERVKDGQFSDDLILNNALLHSEYHLWLEPWFRACGKSKIEVLFFDDLVNEPYEVMVKICRRIGLNSEFYKTFDFKPMNQSGHVRSAELLKLRQFIYKLLPTAGSYKIFRLLYRKINKISLTRKPESDLALIDELYEYFSEPNRKLALMLDRELPVGWIKT